MTSNLFTMSTSRSRKRVSPTADALLLRPRLPTPSCRYSPSRRSGYAAARWSRNRTARPQPESITYILSTGPLTLSAPREAVEAAVGGDAAVAQADAPLLTRLVFGGVPSCSAGPNCWGARFCGFGAAPSSTSTSPRRPKIGALTICVLPNSEDGSTNPSPSISNHRPWWKVGLRKWPAHSPEHDLPSLA